MRAVVITYINVWFISHEYSLFTQYSVLHMSTQNVKEYVNEPIGFGIITNGPVGFTRFVSLLNSIRAI